MSKYKNTSKSLIVFLIIVGIILLGSLYSKPAKAANEYLQGGNGHCQSATLSPYMEIGRSNRDGGYNYPNSNSNNQTNTENGDNWRFGLRLDIPLGSTCTKKYKQTMLQNELLKQQLEMLKLCARYQGLELSDEFAAVRRMCSGVKKKKEVIE